MNFPNALFHLVLRHFLSIYSSLKTIYIYISINKIILDAMEKDLILKIHSYKKK